MYKRLLISALLGSSVLVAGAMPAFTADNGSVVGTVSVPVPPAPCFTLDRSTVDFGTQPFSDPAAIVTPGSPAFPPVQVTSCSTAAENVLGAASDATVPSGGSWDAAEADNSNTCAIGLNSYKPGWSYGGRLYNPRPDGSFAPQAGLDLAAGEGVPVVFHLQMPCRGSAGAGENVSMTFMLLAVLV